MERVWVEREGVACVACAVLTSPRSTISHTTSINEAPGCDGLGEPLVDAPRDSAAEAAAALAAAGKAGAATVVVATVEKEVREVVTAAGTR